MYLSGGHVTRFSIDSPNQEVVGAHGDVWKLDNRCACHCPCTFRFSVRAGDAGNKTSMSHFSCHERMYTSEMDMPLCRGISRESLQWTLVASQGRYVGETITDWRSTPVPTLLFAGGYDVTQVPRVAEPRLDLLTIPTESSNASIARISSDMVSLPSSLKCRLSCM